ncbi:secretion-regulating guanine nucleotide exchange factor isoform X1 [Schistocerca piceifrons]|uniref:secretion-regulating guanine nucleotide exchange factor isoform X1 n=1 Tax=Schistocerca piceifrons TaxID=274613 RepID=UPI001F5F0475|nr:secretion-regulating guanine nucleotide exchange factor isoform X1 [Schistocerca piceifrons]
MKLLAWGANTYGQLGVGYKSELCAEPVEVRAPTIDPKLLTRLCGGGGHTLILDKNGNIYSCGWNNKGQLGRSVEEQATSFEHIAALSGHHIIDISCGWETSFALTRDGKLFGWGSNVYGQLSLPRDQVTFSASPLQLTDHKVKQLSSGLRHTAVVTEQGDVFVCGSGRKGQLGIVHHGQPLKESYTLQHVPGLPPIKMVACGQHHTIALSVCGKIFVWGDNKFGQLGFDPLLHHNFAYPIQLDCSGRESLPQECLLSCGWTHTVLRTEEGKIVNWGRNNYGQLGCAEKQRLESWKPTFLNDVPSTKQIAVGSEHNVALSENSEVLCWGWNEHGSCATGADVDVKSPKKVENAQKAVLIGTGGAHSFAVASLD